MASPKTALTAASVLCLVGSAAAGPVAITYSKPTLDRWMYPFGSTPGLEQRAPAFASLLTPGFDDRDAQFLVGFKTSADIPTGQGPASYVIKSAVLTLTIIDDQKFEYDPTFDSVRTSYAASDPEFLADADTGKPVELFAAGYRNGFSATTFEETSPFGAPAEGARNVFAAIFDSGGAAADASRQVRQRFEAVPLAVGQTDAVKPGKLVPADTRFTFRLDLCNPDTRAYLQRALDTGTLNLVASSLHPATGGPGGGSGNYPVCYTKENPVAQALGFTPTLSIVVNTGARSDFNSDGRFDILDFTAFQNAFALGDPGADVNDDCRLDVLDFTAFQNLFALQK